MRWWLMTVSFETCIKLTLQSGMMQSLLNPRKEPGFIEQILIGCFCASRSQQIWNPEPSQFLRRFPTTSGPHTYLISLQALHFADFDWDRISCDFKEEERVNLLLCCYYDPSPTIHPSIHPSALTILLSTGFHLSLVLASSFLLLLLWY